MTEKSSKGLAVDDAAGRFLRVIGRESLLRSGFSRRNSFAGAKKIKKLTSCGGESLNP
jgi:hypothetical protein